MATYNTPGVYVEEISTLPPSVAQVSTAVPAFIGNTENQPSPNVPQKISNMMEYTALFGGPKSKAYALTATRAGTGYVFGETPSTTADLAKQHILYYALKLYFSNGGGPCYVLSAGSYGTGGKSADKTAYEKGLAAINRLDEPTLLVFPDAASILSAAEYHPLCGEILDACGAKKDRFAILDVPAGDDVSKFRYGVTSDSLKYGAAYTPYLKSAIAFEFKEEDVTVTEQPAPVQVGTPVPPAVVTYTGTIGSLNITFKGAKDLEPKVTVQTASGTGSTSKDALTVQINGLDPNELIIIVPSGNTGVKISDIIQKAPSGLCAFTISADDNKTGEDFDKTNRSGMKLTAQAPPAEPEKSTGITLKKLSTDTTKTILYHAAKAYLNTLPGVILPPSAAMAGVYCRVDAARGVWKAPANVAVANVIGPVSAISDQDQDALNVDPESGKSINAIRSFAGRGTLVWGARTLAGNDNEWRYIPVRRLFITIEESIQKATAFAVFEPNDVPTWLKVKAMIDSYLYGLWQQGALMGAAPKEAYFVNVGLGKTMTEADILEGRLIVEVGIAAVRPAEFIILRFSHKVQGAS